MTNPPDGDRHPSRRAIVAGGLGMLGSAALHPATVAAADASPARTPPKHYNILFILVDQEHFFDRWPIPLPAREWIKQNGIAFANHQAASCVCSSARSVIYTGQHIQHTGIFDNVGFAWQPNMPTTVKTIGNRMTTLGYHAAYQGKWHLSAKLDLARDAIDAPLRQYRHTIASYGFKDFFGVGDIEDRVLGGYNFDETTTAFATRWLRTQAEDLRAKGQPWYLAVNFVNPHDVMYVDSDLPGNVVQGRNNTLPIAAPPSYGVYKDTWDDVPLPPTRSQPLDAPGRPAGQTIYQATQDMLVGAWPNEDRRWKVLQNYYYNCIRDCDIQVGRILDSLRASGMDRDTIIVFTADHGELGGHHQMRGKGTNAYRQQNHLPLMIVHPAYRGGQTCQAVTSQIDLVPTLLALAGGDAAAMRTASAGLPGRSFAGLLADPAAAAVDTLRPAALYNFNMLTYQDARWLRAMASTLITGNLPQPGIVHALEKHPPNFRHRCGIRSVFDGRYRFSRYFSPIEFNTPTGFEALIAQNDLELYDLQDDPDEMANLAASPKAHSALIMAMNAKLNARLAEEVGDDNGLFLPIRNGKWYFPRG